MSPRQGTPIIGWVDCPSCGREYPIPAAKCLVLCLKEGCYATAQITPPEEMLEEQEGGERPDDEGD